MSNHNSYSECSIIFSLPQKERSRKGVVNRMIEIVSEYFGIDENFVNFEGFNPINSYAGFNLESQENIDSIIKNLFIEHIEIGMDFDKVVEQTRKEQQKMEKKANYEVEYHAYEIEQAKLFEYRNASRIMQNIMNVRNELQSLKDEQMNVLDENWNIEKAFKRT